MKTNRVQNILSHYCPTSLRFRLTMLVLVISVFVLVVATTFINDRALSVIEQNSNERLNAANGTLTATVSVWLEPHLNALRTLVSLPDIISMEAERQKPLLQKMAAAYPYMYLISTTDLKGMNVARNDNEKPKDYGDREWFLKARDGAAVTFESLIGKTSHRPALIVAMPIKNEADRIVGVCMFATDLENLTRQVRVTRAGRTGFAYLIDGKNRVIAHPDPVYANNLSDFSAYPPVKALRQGTRGQVSYIDEGGGRWRAYVNELNNGWGVVVQQQEEELLSTQRLFHKVALMIIFTAVLILVCTTWWGVLKALKPINMLTEAVKRVTPDNMNRLDFEFVHSTSLNPKTMDEVSILSDSFYKMAVRLQAAMVSQEQELSERKRAEEELKKNRDRLGDLVEERTTELTNSNERLSQEIEERKHMEFALRESQQMLCLVLDSIPVRVFWKDKNLNYLGCNQQFAKDSGFESSEEILGKNDFAMGWAEQAELYRSDDRMVMETGVPKLNYEEPQTTPDGRKIWLRTSKIPIIDTEGRVYGVLGTYEDISNRKRAEEALKESEERYRIVAENARDVIWVFDLNLGYTFTSPSVKYLRGYTVEEALKQSLDQILTPESYEKAKEIFDREFSLEMNGKRHSPDWSYTTELEMIRKDGSTVWTEVTINILYNEDGTPKGFMGITRDIAKRRRAEEALRKSEEEYRIITDNMRDTIWLMDMNFRTIWISPSVVRNRGFTLEEIVNMPMENNLTPESMQRVTQIISDNFTPEKLNDKDHEIILSSELEFYRKDGSTLWSDVVTTLLRDAYGKPSTLLCVGRDITERKLVEEEKKGLEDQLVRVQKMEAIGTLAGGIAHDFNNLLMGILGNISIMRMNFDDSHPFFDRLTNMEEYVQRGSDLTKQLLGFAQGGKYEIKPTHLGEFIRRSSEMFGRTKKEIRIHHKVPEALWPVEVDRGQMEQVLLNLYVNAWQAMPGGGDLYLSVENVDLDEMDVSPFGVKPGKYVKMTITDTGVGMDEATKDRIFEPFFTTKERGRGTGLGLASVYGIIKNHGGFINVESEKHLGTSFLIFLPASDKNVVDEYIAKEDVQKGQETVLFIDDEDMVLDVGSEMIKGLGYEVMTATGGKQGLEIYEQNRDKIDLVILDMIMPDFSGKDTFDAMQRINPSVRVLLSSGYSLDGQANEIMQNGCKAFIQKPFTMSELSNKIRGILDEQ